MTVIPEPVPAARAAVIQNLAAGIPPQDKGFAPTLMRARIPSGRDVLAYRATLGAHYAAGLDAIGLAGANRSGGARLPERIEPELIGAYAQVSALQLGDEHGRLVGLGLYRLLGEAGRLNGLKRRHLDLYPQLAYAAGEFAEARHAMARKLTPAVVDFLRADLAHPLAEGNDEGAWLAALSTAMTSKSAGVALSPGSLSRLDRLKTAITLPPRHGPLITVITSAYNPGQPLLTAARSMVEQSWQDWELLIVDDASPGADPQVLERVEALDPRIRVIRKAVNGGTYRCRNTALRLARGDFVTTLDSDDWAHPQRLQFGVEPMLAQPWLMATRSQGIRADEEVRVTRPGYAGPFPAASSLMFRMPHVPGRIGFFDTVRKAADTEYARRIEAAFGHPVHDVPREILTILRSSPESLSADDFAAGWRHEARPAYKLAYTRWHEAIAARAADPFFDPEGPRPYPAPRRWTRPVDPQLAQRPQVDIVIAGDWRRLGGPQISMLAEIESCTAAGMRVAVMHLEALRFYTSVDQPLCSPVQDLINAGVVERIFPDDDVEVDILMIRYPPILQFPPALSRTFTPRRLYVMANQAPAEPDGSDPRYVPADVTDNTRALFGVEPQWIPQGPTIRMLLEPEVAAGSLTEWDNPALIDLDAWHVRSDRPVGARPVVGRFSRDDRIKFPDDPKDLLAAYALPEPYVVRMLGAAVTVPKLLQHLDLPVPENWTLLEHKEIDVRQFLRGLDFVVYMDNPNAFEAFGRALLESAASGVVTIAAPKHEATFGAACLYAEPAGVRALLDRLVADPEAYRAQAERAQHHVRTHFATPVFAERIAGLLAEARTEGRADPAPSEPAAPAGEWITVAVRRAADGEHADYLAARHTHAPGAREAALDVLRTLAETQPAGVPLTAADLAAVWHRGVTDVAQSVGGEVLRFTT